VLRALDITAITGVVVKAAAPPSALTTTTPFCGSYATDDGAPYVSVKRFDSHADYANEVVDVSMNRRLPNPKRDIAGVGIEAVLVDRAREHDKVLAAWDGQHGLAIFAVGPVDEHVLEQLVMKGLSSPEDSPKARFTDRGLPLETLLRVARQTPQNWWGASQRCQE